MRRELEGARAGTSARRLSQQDSTEATRDLAAPGTDLSPLSEAVAALLMAGTMSAILVDDAPPQQSVRAKHGGRDRGRRLRVAARRRAVVASWKLRLRLNARTLRHCHALLAA